MVVAFNQEALVGAFSVIVKTLAMVRCSSIISVKQVSSLDCPEICFGDRSSHYTEDEQE